MNGRQRKRRCGRIAASGDKGEAKTLKRFEDKKYSKTKQTVVILLLVTAMSFAGCGQTESSGTAATPAPTAQAERIDTGFVVTNPDSYDSADTAVLVDINNVDNTVTLLNLDLGKRYTLSMDGTTRFADKYGKAISLSQLQEGDIVDVTFLKSQKHLTSMQLAQTAWQYDDVEHYEMNTVRNEVAIGEEVFQLSKDTQYFSQGHSIEKMDLIDTGFVVTNPDSYDSADTAVLVDINNVDNTVTLLNLDLGKRYTLSMDGTTRFADKYGKAISLSQLQEGDIVDVTFLKSQKHLTSMQLAQTAWQYDDVEHYEMNTVRNEVAIGEEVFQLSKDTQYFSQGHSIEKMDLNPADILTFHGIDSTVLSVTVEKGHGYLRLVNDENFVGGWLEIGQTQIVRITEDMLVTVPEGSYQVDISYNGGGGTKNVVINRNEETTLDIGDLEVAEAQYGMVLFSLNPSDAELYIDGSQVDASQPVTLEYGIHQIIAKADGYKSLTQYLRVGQESAGVDVQLDKADSDSEDSTESSSSSSSSATESTSTADTTTTYYRVHIDAPENVEVYLDGNYVGISPCSFKKTSGSHVITLRKSGYETRSYTVQVDEEEKDVSYSFVDLTPSSSSTE